MGAGSAARVAPASCHSLCNSARFTRQVYAIVASAGRTGRPTAAVTGPPAHHLLRRTKVTHGLRLLPGRHQSRPPSDQLEDVGRAHDPVLVQRPPRSSRLYALFNLIVFAVLMMALAAFIHFFTHLLATSGSTLNGASPLNVNVQAQSGSFSWRPAPVGASRPRGRQTGRCRQSLLRRPPATGRHRPHCHRRLRFSRRCRRLPRRLGHPSHSPDARPRPVRLARRLGMPYKILPPPGDPRGALAQLGERLDRTQEVSGSIPLCSTTKLLQTALRQRLPWSRSRRDVHILSTTPF